MVLRSPILVPTCLAVASLCVPGQPARAPSFEVASVRPASPSASAISCSGGPGTASPRIWRCSNVPLAFLISRAYGFQAWQFLPNDPCCRERFDLNAELPEGATKEQFQQMMRSLLEERFRLKLHYERKEMPVYGLTVAESGPKMKESAAATSSAAEDPWAPSEFDAGKDGYPVFPPGRGGLAGANGHYRWVGFHVSMQEIARTLSFHLGRPVVDETGLKGQYDIELRWWIDVAWLLEQSGRQDDVKDLGGTGRSGPSLIRAVQDQLGLKLNSRRGPGDVVAIDHLEKTPTGN